MNKVSGKMQKWITENKGLSWDEPGACIPELVSSEDLEAHKVHKKMLELAQRAVACRCWRWMPGMAVFNPDMPNIWYPRIGDECAPRHSFLLPDLRDPITLWGLLAVLREARGACSFFKTDEGWSVQSPHGVEWAQGESEAAALVAALEAGVK